MTGELRGNTDIKRIAAFWSEAERDEARIAAGDLFDQATGLQIALDTEKAKLAAAEARLQVAVDGLKRIESCVISSRLVTNGEGVITERIPIQHLVNLIARDTLAALDAARDGTAPSSPA